MCGRLTQACPWALRLVLCVILWTDPTLGDMIGTASVIDGNTIKIHGERIRLHGIDAPESRQLFTMDSKPWMCGKDAANALANWIGRRPVTCEELDRDRYDRIVARCTAAGEDLGEWMVSHGWAVAYYQYSTSTSGPSTTRRRGGLVNSDFRIARRQGPAPHAGLGRVRDGLAPAKRIPHSAIPFLVAGAIDTRKDTERWKISSRATRSPTRSC